MKKLVFLILLIPLFLYPQKGMVLIEGFEESMIWNARYSNVSIEVPDKSTYNLLNMWEVYMDSNPIKYIEYLDKVDKIEIVYEDRYFVSEYKNKTIYLNKRLERFPNCKKAAILQELFILAGGEVDNSKRSSILFNFNVTKDTEDLFGRQLKHDYMINLIVDKLKEKN